MEQLIQFASVPLITILVYATLALYKYAIGKNEKWIKLIPVIAVLLGSILGIISFYGIKDIMPADNVLVAILIGGASGAAATGSHQIFKQFSKETVEDSDNEKDENNS